MFSIRFSFPLLAVASWPVIALAGGMTVSSQNFTANGPIASEQVFNGFGCTGENVSPELSWKGAPKGTKSYAVLVHDPDAPTGGSGWWHWVVLNIPASVTHLPAGAGTPGNKLLPEGATQVTTDFGTAAWGGPCPPQGDKPHRYVFTVYALDANRIELPAGATAALAGYMVNQSPLAKATVTGRYGRPALAKK